MNELPENIPHYTILDKLIKNRSIREFVQSNFFSLPPEEVLFGFDDSINNYNIVKLEALVWTDCYGDGDLGKFLIAEKALENNCKYVSNFVKIKYSRAHEGERLMKYFATGLISKQKPL